MMRERVLDFDNEHFLETGDVRPSVNVIEQDPQFPRWKTKRLYQLYEAVEGGDEKGQVNAVSDGDLSRDERLLLLEYLRESGKIGLELHALLYPTARGQIDRHTRPTVKQHLDAFDKLVEMSLSPLKWKVLKITRFGYGRGGEAMGWKGYKSAHRVVSVLRESSNRKRSAAYMQYLPGTATSKAKRDDQSKFGKTLHFLTITDPWVLSEEMIDVEGGRDEFMLALIWSVPIKYTSDRLLLRVSQPRVNNDERLDDKEKVDCMLSHLGHLCYINAIRVVCLIGLVLCDDRTYITWEDTCFTDVGLNVN